MSSHDISTSSFPSAHRVTMHYPRMVASTGERPIFVVCTNKEEYWCKRFDHDSSGVTVVNEIVAAEIAKLINAPVRNWAIVDVPEEFRNHRVLDADIMYPTTPMFGSSHITNAYSADEVTWVSRDGNYGRIPLLIALWHLCNADDIQVIYDMSADSQIYSIDHGYWFGSYEGPRDFYDAMTTYQPLPRILGKIPNEYWNKACEYLEEFRTKSTDHIFHLLPHEWGIQEQEIREMVEYAQGRVGFTLSQLRKFQAKYHS